jgi:hypothetical protein
MLLFVSSAALLAIECLYLLWLRERSWERVTLPRQRIAFPPFCPSCLVAATEVECVEGSFSRTVGPTRKEFVALTVPYCKICGTALNLDRKRAWNAVVVPVMVTIAGSWMWGTFGAPDGNDWIGTASLIGLPVVWPIYSIYSHRKRAVCARRYNRQIIEVRAKHLVYAEALRQLNPSGELSAPAR